MPVRKITLNRTLRSCMDNLSNNMTIKEGKLTRVEIFWKVRKMTMTLEQIRPRDQSLNAATADIHYSLPRGVSLSFSPTLSHVPNAERQKANSSEETKCSKVKSSKYHKPFVDFFGT